MARVVMTLEVEFETKDYNSARASSTRLPGDVHYAIQHGKLGTMTGVVPGTVKVIKTNEKIT
jgi:hypothetical protein